MRILWMVVLLIGGTVARAEPVVLEVWKTPTCGCCGGWVEAMREAGFDVRTTTLDDLSTIRTLAGVPEALGSCHTAMVDGYAIEGHVPADAITRLLADRPAARGLSAPGMPLGSPGMSGPAEPFDVMLFDGARAQVWGTYEGETRVD